MLCEVFKYISDHWWKGEVSTTQSRLLHWGPTQLAATAPCGHSLWHPRVLSPLSYVISRCITKCPSVSTLGLAFSPASAPSVCPFTRDNLGYFQIQLHLLWSSHHKPSSTQSNLCLLITYRDRGVTQYLVENPYRVLNDYYTDLLEFGDFFQNIPWIYIYIIIYPLIFYKSITKDIYKSVGLFARQFLRKKMVLGVHMSFCL